MARKRMISPNIWQDPDFGKLSSEAKLMFLGIISNADDEGRMRGNSAFLRSIIFVYETHLITTTEKIRDEVVQAMKNVMLYEVNNEEYIQLKNWNRYQKQREDRLVLSEFPAPDGYLSDICLTDDGQLPAKEKRREVKLGEVKLESTLDYLSKLPSTDVKEITDRFVVTEKQLKSKAEDLLLYCRSKKKTYSNYKAFLLNAVKKDFKEKADTPTGGKYKDL